MEQGTLFNFPPAYGTPCSGKPAKSSYAYSACEFKVVALRDCPFPERTIDTPERAADYWREHIPTHPLFNPEVECLVVITLNTRSVVKGHFFVSMGTQDTIFCHAREVFRGAVITAAHSVLVAHNHPSGDPTPSQADIKVTRDLIAAGETLKIPVTDHFIMGRKNPARPKDYVSLRELGYFYS